MINKKHIVGFVRDHARHPIKGQRALMSEHDITKVYDDMDLCIRQRRRDRGDTVAVKLAMLLANPAHRRKGGGMRQSLYNAVDALESLGVEIVELATNRTTADARQRDLIIRDAVEYLARTRHATKPPGRPPNEWSEIELALMREHWFSTRHITNADAVAAIVEAGIKDATVSTVYKAMKAGSGRPIGPKRSTEER